MYEAVIIGGGACGIMTAIQAGYLGKRTLILESNEKLGAKILISGGGRCNFTNFNTTDSQFISKNKHFIKSALSQWTVEDTIQFFEQLGIESQEKTLGQLFPKEGNAKDIMIGLEQLLVDLGQDIRCNCKVTGAEKIGETFLIHALEEDIPIEIECTQLVVASGGLPIPKMGASAIGLNIAREFQIPIIPPYPALVPLVSNMSERNLYESLMGNTVYAKVQLHGHTFEENILFTHWGLSGPAILQISSYYKPGDTIEIDLLPQQNIVAFVKNMRQKNGKLSLKALLQQLYSNKLGEALYKIIRIAPKNIADLTEADFNIISNTIHHYQFKAVGDKGYEKAEVMRGGIDTNALNSRTLESTSISGLFFGGEVVDVTGWLGGYNFQWAWASGYVIAQNI